MNKITALLDIILVYNQKIENLKDQFDNALKANNIDGEIKIQLIGNKFDPDLLGSITTKKINQEFYTGKKNSWYIYENKKRSIKLRSTTIKKPGN